MKPLACWLCLLGALRLWAVYWGYFSIWGLQTAVYSLSPMSEVHGRTFGVWTLLTCTLCFLCASDLDNKGLFTATHISFVYALLHFSLEFFVYRSMALANFASVGSFAGISTVWMLVYRLSNPAFSKQSKKA